MPDTGLPSGGPCQAPPFFLSPPPVKKETRAFSFAGRRNCNRAGRLAGREQQQTRRRDQLVLGSRAYGTVLKCGHFCPSGEWAKVQPATSRLAKYRRLRQQRVAKMYGQQKRNIIHKSSTAYEQDHSDQRNELAPFHLYRPLSKP